MSDDKLQKAIGDGARAKALLDNEALAGAFEALQRDYTTAWLNTAARDTEGRERLWQAIQIVGLVRGHLSRVVTNGKIAQAELEQLANATQ